MTVFMYPDPYHTYTHCIPWLTEEQDEIERATMMDEEYAAALADVEAWFEVSRTIV